MLVLTRKTGQKLVIDNDIIITVLETKGDSVKLGIAAPKSVSIFREEIHEEIKRANQQATNAPKADALTEALQLLDPQKRHSSEPPKNVP